MQLTISQLITELQALQEQHGDLPAAITGFEYAGHDHDDFDLAFAIVEGKYSAEARHLGHTRYVSIW